MFEQLVDKLWFMLNITRNQYTLHPCKLLTVFQNQSMTPHHSEMLVNKIKK